MSIVLNFVFLFFIPRVYLCNESEQTCLRNILFVLNSRNPFTYAMYVVFIRMSVIHCRKLGVKCNIQLYIHSSTWSPCVIKLLRENHGPFRFSAIFLPASIMRVKTFMKIKFCKPNEQHLDTSNQTLQHLISNLSDRLMNAKKSSRVHVECFCCLFLIITSCKNGTSNRDVQIFNDVIRK
jgi:hypothetical protein